jgi:hypothetical protein
MLAYGRSPRKGTSKTKQEKPPDIHIVQKCIEVLLTYFRLCGFNDGGYSPKGTIHWHKLCVERMGGNWIAFYKYKLAALYSAAEDQPLPAIPKGLEKPIENEAIDKPSVIFGGKLLRWLHIEKEKDVEHYRDICYGALQAKRGLPRPDKAFLDQSLTDTFIKLVTHKKEPVYPESGRYLVPPNSVFRDLATYNELENVELGIDQQTWETELRRDVEEVFGGKEFTNDHRYQTFFPSTNANYNMSRAEGGGLGEILTCPGLIEPLQDKEGTIKSEYNKGLLAIDTTQLDQKFRKLQERVLDRAMKEEATVELVALAEALKSRVISKGPPLTYFYLKSLQRFMWDILFKDKSNAFRLIGQEITNNYLCEQLRPLRDDESFLSGDYKDATNNLKPWVSECIADEISKQCKLSPNESALFKRALTGHTIRPPAHVFGISKMSQRHGQLMGSIVSFIVLCMANATVMRRSREASVGRQLTIKTANFAVNGDDCTARLNQRGLEAWRGYGKSIGLEESVGKTYFSKRFLNMNSARFVVKPIKQRTHQNIYLYDEQGQQTMLRDLKITDLFLEHRKFVNLGLCFGLKRSTKGDLTRTNVSDIGTEQSWGAIAHDLRKTCPTKFWGRAYKLFLNQNWEAMSQTKRPWFLPERLGGLGLPVDEEHQPTEKDLRLAAAVYKLGGLPANPQMTTWKIWSIAQKVQEKIKTGAQSSEAGIRSFYEHQTGGAMINNAALMARICVSLLFTHSLKELMSDQEGEVVSYHKTCDKLMKRAYKIMSVTEKFSRDALPSFYKRSDEIESHVLLTTIRLDRYTDANREIIRSSTFYNTIDYNRWREEDEPDWTS